MTGRMIGVADGHKYFAVSYPTWICHPTFGWPYQNLALYLL